MLENKRNDRINTRGVSMEKTYADKFIDKTISIMNRKEINQSELARRIDVNISSLRRYLNKERPLPFHVAIAIALELNIDITRLFGMIDNPLDEDEYIAYLEFKKVFVKHI